MLNTQAGDTRLTTATKTEQISSDNFWPFFPAGPLIFLKSPIGCISSHNNVNSRVIKHFKGQRLLGFYFSFEISQYRTQKQLSQCNFLVHTLLYIKEAVLRSASFSWSVAFHAIRTREEHLRKSTKEANFITKGAIESVRINEVSVLSASWHESKKYLFIYQNSNRSRTGQLASSN